MSDEVIAKDERWRNKHNQRIALVLHASHPSDFTGPSAADVLANSMVMYRYQRKAGRSVQTMSIARKSFLGHFERVK